eukprot:CAMPEP_0182897238 /NCGR_PEP_ID=MMETSP0034_2-20130328/26768_1 /TAXON_ID=156128 /ORGANISM="Nephroselmis pyriformis, Strain CCMP717" /LENGTH=55 /DNA_ID=CAMNT_0025031145 /DNA_START=338 /DNA_END=502 /DNA_ORIENTATION=+
MSSATLFSCSVFCITGIVSVSARFPSPFLRNFRCLSFRRRCRSASAASSAASRAS